MSDKGKKGKKGGKSSYKRTYKRKTNTYYDYGHRMKLLRPPYVRRMTGEPEPATEAEWARTAFGPSLEFSTAEQKLARANAGYRGRGLYGGMGKYGWSDFKKDWKSTGLGKSLARSGRRLIGAATDKAIGMIGGGLYGGMGEYVDNALIEGGMPTMQIQAQNDETDNITFSCYEFVKPIYAPNIPSGSSSFAATRLEVNPGLSSFAPKLAALAANYQEYEIHQMVFHYETKINESQVNNGITGDLYLVFNYDPVTDPFDNEQDVMQTSGHVKGKITENLRAGVECDPSKIKDTEYFIRTAPVPLGRDADEYDHGALIIASNNIPSNFSNLAIGDLYVYYNVTLRQFKPGVSKLNNQSRDLFVDPCSVSTSEPQVFNQNLNTDKTCLVAQQSNIGGQVSSPGLAQLTYTFPADVNGYYRLMLNIEGTSLTRTGTTITSTGTISQLATMYGTGAPGDTPNSMQDYFNTVKNICIADFKVRSAVGSTNNSITFQFTGGAGTGTVTQWSLEVVEMGQNLWQSRNTVTPKFINFFTGIESSV